MAITRKVAAAVLCGGLTLSAAAPAWADDPNGTGGGAPVPAPAAAADGPLNGGFMYFLNGNRRSVWVINSSCDPAGFCTGQVTSSRNWTAPITRGPGTWWAIERDSPTDGWVCPDGTQAPAHYSYLLDPTNLTGTLTYTKAPGACGTLETPTDTDSITLNLI